MYCPNCGTQNTGANKFCIKCGKALPQVQIPSQPAPTPVPSPVGPSANPLTSIATTGGLIGIAGGALIVIGWLTPWFDFSSLLGPLLRLVGLGFGLLGLPSLVLSTQMGSGLQISLALFLLSLGMFDVAFRPNSGSLGVVMIGLVALALAIVFVSIPFMAISFVRAGIRMLEKRTSTSSLDLENIKTDLRKFRSRSKKVFICMAVIFVVVLILTGQLGSLLSGGFYLTIAGALVTYFGAILVQSQLAVPSTPGSDAAISSTTLNTRLTPKPALAEPITNDEHQVLQLLAQGLPNTEIVAKLNSDSDHVSLQIRSLQTKLGAADTGDLIKRAKDQGLIPSS